jgi:hypothetical protein
MRPGTPAFHPAKLKQESSDAEADTYLFSNAGVLVQLPLI